MKIVDFLSYLASLNIKVLADGEQLRINDSQGVLTPALRAELVEREADILEFLQVQGEVLESQLSYWKQQLEGLPHTLELPTDRPRPAVQTDRGSTQAITLAKDLSDALKALSRQEGVTLFMTLLAAFKVLLYRYAAQEDIVVGTPIVNRNRSESEGETGFLVNTLVLRTDLSGNPSFRELLARLREVALGAYAHQDLPFEKLVEALQPERDQSRSPLCQVMFGLQHTSQPALESSQLSSSPTEVELDPAKYDLTLSMIETSDRLQGTFAYKADLFDPATVSRMVGHFQTLLEGIVTDPRQRLSDLPLLTEAERYQLLVEWNDTQTDYPQDSCIHELVEAQVERTPDNIAVVFKDEQLTYRELNQRANQLAHYLQRSGVEPETLVGICVERSLEMVVGVLGILKAGGSYVPFDPTYPTERLAFMLADTQTPVLLTQQHLVDRLPKENVNLICLDTNWAQISQESQKAVVSNVKPDNLAYIIYTSGSTGRPKGVQIEHKSLLNLVNWHLAEFKVTAVDRATQVASLAFDACVWELWPYLSVGASIYISGEETRLSPEKLRDWLVSQGITISFLPTPLAERMLRLKWPADVALRTLLTGGDKLYRYPPTDLPFELVNNYGPTENTVVTTSGTIVPNEVPGLAPPIGGPIANVQLYILDAYLQPVPVGVPGELYIGGISLARGYLNRPELTTEQFITKPLKEVTHTRLYKTGDLVRYLQDGRIEFIGRVDHQLKIRGFRIEPGEIETTLGKHPAVWKVVVLAHEDTPGNKHLVAYIVPREGHVPATTDLDRFLKEKLPDYMIPSHYVSLDNLPLTPNGKLDRGALPAPDPTRPELESAFVAPRTPNEEILAGLGAEVLGLERIGIHDNLFELGAHSLLVTQLISRVREVLKVELPLNSIFENPTVVDLAKIIENGHREASSLEFPAIQFMPRDGELPLSFSQERVWFIHQLNSSNIAYHFQATFRFKGLLDVTALEQSLNEIVRRHEIFRTTFQTINGRPNQVIHPPQVVELSRVDLQTLPEPEREAEARRLIKQEVQQPFDLAQLPLIRWTLVQLSEREFILVHVEHHIVHDGWSFNIFLQELQNLYEAFSTRKPSPLPELPIQFADFAYWQRQWMQGAVAETQLDYWQQKLTGDLPALQLPFDRPRPPVQRFRGAAPRIELPLELCESLRVVSRREGSTLFMTMLAAFVTLLYRYSGQDDLCVGSGIANRRWRETEQLIGMLVNNVVLRTDLSGNPTFRELLGRVRQETLEAYMHQDVPFDAVVDKLQPERDLSRNPLFQVMFSFHDSPLLDLKLPGLALDLHEGLNNGSAKFDLNIVAIPRSEQRVGLSPKAGADGIDIIWEYNTDLFDDTTIARMIEHYQVLLHGIVADPGQRLAALPLLTEAEHQQLLVVWNDTQTDYPRNACIQHLFEAQVEQTPDAIAVSFNNEQLTYSQLNRRANQLAHYLQAQGVGPEVCVGLCLERSVEMIVGILGILKAGGAYVPLDPEYPQERLRFMLSDTQAPLLLTQQRLVSELPEHPGRVICLDTDWAAVDHESDPNPSSQATAKSLAYVMYTSGSTGRPKGTCITHRNVVRLVQNTNYAELSARQVFLQFAPISFDAATLEIWGALLNGGRLVVFPAHKPTLAELGEVIQRDQVTTLWLTAGLFHQMVDEHLESLKSVRQLMAGGDVLSVPHVLKVLQELDGCTLINGYGPTENTTFTTCYRMTDPKQVGPTVSIGRPIAQTQVYILDRQLQPVPIGVRGELYIGGDGLARSYLNRPELTAEKFIPDPFSAEPGSRLYKTGDAARYLPDGNIEFLGRLDDQVKVRGFRVELGEIETVLGQHPGVQKNVILAREDSAGNKRLVAYIVPSREPAPTISEWRKFLKQKLPGHMIPSTFVTIDNLPLSPNGKVDRQALPDPAKARSDLKEGTFVAPRTKVEEVVAGICAEVLELERIGIYDNFFELGGHSLLAMQVISRLGEAFQMELSLRSLFEAPTVAGLAKHVETIHQTVQNLRASAPTGDREEIEL